MAYTENLPVPPYGGGGSYGCDLCGNGGNGNDGVFHCPDCGNYDVCLKCNDKAKAKVDGAPAAEEKEEAKAIEHIDGPLLKISFMSGDKSENDYNEYFATMPWTSDGYDKSSYQKWMKEFDIGGIPTLVVMNKDGKTFASKEGRGDVGEGPLCVKKWFEQAK